KHSKLLIEIIRLGIFIGIIEECILRGSLIKVMFEKKEWLGVIIWIILFRVGDGGRKVRD
ncbi:CPBP family glutamic-type intramembrane protease, partial [Staphylococcus epidermidis]|uniref:CPBP family glutamic-type intramembrane protease n=1 Tax=Staphylococcus epidermidis TaxID=1282 RepID=UPI0037DA60AA